MADPTRDELLAEADRRGITVADRDDPKTTKAVIQGLLDAPAAGDSTSSSRTDPKTADLAVDAKHPDSIVEPLPDSMKPGPGSIMSREIRPDERDLAPGTSALQDPPASST